MRYFDLLTNSIYRDIDTVVFEYDSVRPKGEKLETFGGTASGYESLERMFKKIDTILSGVKKEKLDGMNRYSLRPIDAMDFANVIAENVVSGGVRRSSQICLFSADDKEIIEAKSNLYKQVDGEWVLNEEISHRQMSNNTIYYEDKPSKEQLSWHVKQMRFSGEPGFLNVEEAKRRREDFNGVNPCFTGDMKLLTDDGYKTFEELNGKNIGVVNINGEVTNGKVWSNGVKEVIELTLSNGRKIKCTPDHKFMLEDGETKLANELLGKKLNTYGIDELLWVTSIESIGEEEVYDFNEPETHWGVVEGCVVHNCAEILLDSKGVCNLTTTNCMMFVNDGELDREGILEAQRLAARAGYRMANVEFELNDWDRINERDRLIGVSITGWQDMVNALGWDDSFKEALNKKDELISSYLTGGKTGDGYLPSGILKQIKLLSDMKKAAIDGAESLAAEVGGVEPKLVTTVKPEGTQSQMPTVSSGLHYSHSPYFIRRVRISATDPLVDVCDELGYTIKPENGHDPENPETVVLEFPVKAPDGITKVDVSAIEQLEMYRMFMKTYVEHNASITVHVRDDEWGDVEKWLWDNWDDVVGVSFISYNDNFYDLMPYEEIDEETYLEMEENMKPFRTSLISKYEIEHKERLINDSSCESGACPVR